MLAELFLFAYTSFFSRNSKWRSRQTNIHVNNTKINKNIRTKRWKVEEGRVNHKYNDLYEGTVVNNRKLEGQGLGTPH